MIRLVADYSPFRSDLVDLGWFHWKWLAKWKAHVWVKKHPFGRVVLLSEEDGKKLYLQYGERVLSDTTMGLRENLERAIYEAEFGESMFGWEDCCVENKDVASRIKKQAQVVLVELSHRGLL